MDFAGTEPSFAAWPSDLLHGLFQSWGMTPVNPFSSAGSNFKNPFRHGARSRIRIHIDPFQQQVVANLFEKSAKQDCFFDSRVTVLTANQPARCSILRIDQHVLSDFIGQKIIRRQEHPIGIHGKIGVRVGFVCW